MSDLDFTLLQSDATVSARTVEVINALVAAGLRFTYATARSFGSARRATHGLRLELPVITYGGTMTVDPRTGVPDAVAGMPESIIADILDVSEIHPRVQALVHTYQGGRDAISWRSDVVTAGVEHFLATRAGDPRLSPRESWAGADLSGAYYVSIIGDRVDLHELRARLAAVLSGCLLILSDDPYTPSIAWLEIHADRGSKAEAAAALAERIGATRIVAFGDNHNDVPLFRIADESYAVANAVPELRELATGVLAGNDADAVAEWLALRWSGVAEERTGHSPGSPPPA